MRKQTYPARLLRLLKSVKAKRPKIVIDHILKHGQITTEDIRDTYGYNHPPRAVRDVREHGIPIVTFRVTGKNGKRIAAYKFGDVSKISVSQLSGRTAFSSGLKTALIEKNGSRCNIYLGNFPARELQIDHRVPFEIGGDDAVLSDDVSEYMLLCASANRAKSWSCENCANWKRRDVATCQSCYWAYPESYKHIAMRDVRRLDILWSGEETAEYDELMEQASIAQKEIPEYVKDVLRNHFKNRNG